jgi:membrane-associated protease RseP (regulator of RpoE activity)
MAATIVGMVCICISILVHEWGHAYMARRYGGRDIRIVLYGLGGLAMHTGQTTPKERMNILIAGPGAGFLLGGIVFLLREFQIDVGPYLAHYAMAWLLWINIVWGMINLVPLYPLDGGQILLTFLGANKGPKGELLALKISMVTGCILAILALTYNLFLMACLCVFLVFENWQLHEIGGPSGGMPGKWHR